MPATPPCLDQVPDQAQGAPSGSGMLAQGRGCPIIDQDNITEPEAERPEGLGAMAPTALQTERARGPGMVLPDGPGLATNPPQDICSQEANFQPSFGLQVSTRRDQVLESPRDALGPQHEEKKDCANAAAQNILSGPAFRAQGSAYKEERVSPLSSAESDLTC